MLGTTRGVSHGLTANRVPRYVGQGLRFRPLTFSPGLHWYFTFEDMSFKSVSVLELLSILKENYKIMKMA